MYNNEVPCREMYGRRESCNLISIMDDPFDTVGQTFGTFGEPDLSQNSWRIRLDRTGRWKTFASFVPSWFLVLVGQTLVWKNRPVSECLRVCNTTNKIRTISVVVFVDVAVLFCATHPATLRGAECSPKWDRRVPRWRWPDWYTLSCRISG